MIFNPDPKLQAQEMIKQFIGYVSFRNAAGEYSETQEQNNAVCCALIAAEMCQRQHKVVQVDLTSSSGVRETNEHAYWSAVIKELKKLNQ